MFAKFQSLATGKSNNPMLIGYARVYKYDDQNTAAQLRALKENGCDRIFKKRPPVGVGIGKKSAADLARMFKVHSATVSRLIAQSAVVGHATDSKH